MLLFLLILLILLILLLLPCFFIDIKINESGERKWFGLGKKKPLFSFKLKEYRYGSTVLKYKVYDKKTSLKIK